MITQPVAGGPGGVVDLGRRRPADVRRVETGERVPEVSYGAARLSRCQDLPRAPRRSAQDRPRPGPGLRRRRPPRTRSSRGPRRDRRASSPPWDRRIPRGTTRPAVRPALIASGLSRNWSASLSPVCTWVSPSASPPSTREQTTMEVPGRRSTTVPTRCHREVESTKVGWPSRGTRGQKTHRPQSTRTQGSTSRTAVAATTMPTAQARPSARVVGKTDSNRVSRPTITVVELASTALLVAASARRMASYRSWWSLSSSR